jgi:class 3 adenylate cyclase/tetratricopeptide (TPR) repeat protein
VSLQESVCPACEARSPSGARFCSNCGDPLGTPCQSCGFVNDAGARYCSACGTSLAPPKPEGMEASRERRIVTALFADVSGSTSLAEQVDPEEWADIMDGLFPIMNAAVARYAGTVARLMGDAILAFFGAPVANEDDPERAVRAALDMLREVTPYRERVLQRLAEMGLHPAPTDLAIRVGINTGEVVVGDVGSDVRAEYTALGDAVNVAARMEQTAEPGTIRISADTHARVAHVFEVEPLGPIEVKGKALPIETFRVAGLRAERGSDRGLGRDAPLVGRGDELAQLAAALGRVRTGRSTIVMLLGEPGIGKSRLLAEARQAAMGTSPPPVWIETSCLSFESTHPYALGRRLVLGLVDGTGHPGEVPLSDVDGRRRPRLIAALEALLGASPGWSGAPDPDATRTDLFEASSEILVELVTRQPERPVVVAVDDLHWADAVSADLVAALFEVSDRVPVMFVCAGRPDRQGPGWRLKQDAETGYPHRTVTIDLDPLAAEEAAGLIDGLLSAAHVPAELTGAIVTRADGNPYFVEELVRELIQMGVIVRLPDGAGWGAAPGAAAPDLPDSLQTLLRTRIDRLGPGPRAALEVAAVIGRTFDRAVLEAVAPSSDPGRDLATLLQVGLVVEEAGPTERAYAFRHGLTQEAAYRSMVRSRRSRIHLSVGQTLERLHAAEAIEWAPVLAHHFAEAGDGGRAATYSLMAAERAAGMSALVEASGHFDRGLEAVDESVASDIVVRLHLGRGRVRDRSGDFDGALADFDAAARLAREPGDDDLAWQVEVAAGELWASRDYRRTGTHYRRALEMARASADPAMLGASLNRLGNWYVNTDDPSEGIDLHRQALDIFGSRADGAGRATTLDLLGMAHAISGDMAGALSHYRLAVDAFRELDDRVGLASALVSIALGAPSYEAIAYPPTMSIGDGVATVEEALDLTMEIGWRTGEAYARFILAQLLGCAGRIGHGLAEANRALNLSRRLGHRQWEVGSLLVIGSLLWDILAFERSLPVLEEALATAEEVGSLFWIMHCSGALAMTLTASDRHDEAARLAHRELGRPKAGEYGAHRVCLFALAQASRRRGNHEEAAALLDELELGHQGVVIPAVSLERGRLMAAGDPAAAADHLRAGLAAAEETGFWGMQWRTHRELGALPDGDPLHWSRAAELVESGASTLDSDLAAGLRRGALAGLG